MMTTSHARESDLDDSMRVPGTIRLFRINGTFERQHRSEMVREIVLTPHPSNDTNDPLNWSRWRKACVITAICAYTLSVGNASAAIYSAFGQISVKTGLSLQNLNEGTGYMFLAFGWGCLFWQPLALQYGKRPVYLMSLLGTIATQIWTPFVTTNPHWILNKLLQGFFGAPIESLCQISIADVHFQHKRGRYISLYTLSLGGSSTMAPVFAGLISERQTWKWVAYLASILCAFSFLMCLFLMEETNYDRAYDVETEDRNGLTTSVSDPCSAFESRVGVSEVHGYTRSGSGGNVLSHPSRQGFLDRLHIFRKSDFRKKNRVARRAWAPIILFRFPIVVYTGFMYGSYLVWTNLLNGTVAYVLGQSPYNFGASSIGLSYLSAFVGVFCGCLYTGWFGDKFAMWMAKRNCGFYEPEHRLWLIVPSVFAVPCGLTLWGIGAAYGVHWSACVLAMGLISFGNSAGMQVSICYCIDSYKECSPEAMVTVMLIRNSMSFAAGYGITPWVMDLGLRDAFVIASCVAVAQCLTFVLFLRYGKQLRVRTAQIYGQLAD